MTDNRTPKRDPEYHLEEIDGELLLYNPSKTQTLYLNETAAIIWQLCDGKRSEREIVEMLVASFPEAADSIESDIREALREIEEIGAVGYE